jgi:hypothetical protein
VITASELMAAFEQRDKRYLWTDAFAVCNYVGLGRVDAAVALVDRVHRELGRHRADDGRTGWISGLSEAEGQAHPTLGGLRIGKRLQERSPGERFDERLEWDRDGQYFHYLTKWMHALARVAAATGEPKYLGWARELADTAFRRFVHGARMYWKMSIDLMRPQVASMGHHDPLDGAVTSLALELTDLAGAYRQMIDPAGLATTDALGIGGLLVDAHRLRQLDRDRPLRDALIVAAEAGLERYVRAGELELPAAHRLAFRELGLAIGLAAAGDEPRLARFAQVRGMIEAFWLDDEHRRSRTYVDHRDINDVMLATSLAPQGFLGS